MSQRDEKLARALELGFARNRCAICNEMVLAAASLLDGEHTNAALCSITCKLAFDATEDDRLRDLCGGLQRTLLKLRKRSPWDEGQVRLIDRAMQGDFDDA